MAKRRSKTLSEYQHVPNVPENSFLPPGAPMANTEATNTSEAQGTPEGSEGYPAVQNTTMTAEELKAKEAAEAETRVNRAKRATGPRRLNPNERKVVGWWLEKYIGEHDPIDKEVPFSEIDHDTKAFFQPSMKDNVVQRGIFNAVYDTETQQLKAVKLTEIGATLFAAQMRKLPLNDGEPKGKVTRGIRKTKRVSSENGEEVVSIIYDDNVRLRKLADKNPRRDRVHGWFSWEMYENGMTYRQYLRKKYDETWTTAGGSVFSGPRRDHWEWDLNHGYTGLYYADQPEFLEDGSPNPKFWFINKMKEVKTNEPATE